MKLPDRIRDQIYIESNTGCWLWMGGINHYGYGRTHLCGKRVYTHRLTYLLTVGPIAEGLELDHLCRTRSCCNPRHLEAVTRKVNLSRGNINQHHNKTHCINGHPFSGHNLIVTPSKRICRTCRNESSRQSRIKRKEYVKNTAS
jgi:hypothetical protein